MTSRYAQLFSRGENTLGFLIYLEVMLKAMLMMDRLARGLTSLMRSV
jgi:hypothetical protein